MIKDGFLSVTKDENEFCKLIEPFIAQVESGKIEIYNEFSLQHELGVYFRTLFPDAKVQFERNVKFFFPTGFVFVKREIDIAIYSNEKKLIWAIELKFPRNGQHPEQMFSFCRDLMFVEQLKAAGFARTALLIFAEDELFWRGPANGIYSYFRGGHELNGLVRKPTGSKDEIITISGRHKVNWQAITDHLKFTAIEVANIQDQVS